MPGRNFSATSYRYGFNGKEKQDELHGNSGDAYDFGARIYDARLGRFLSIDRFTSRFPYYSPYLFAGCSPIGAVDDNGDSLKLKFIGDLVMNLYVSWVNKQLEGQFEIKLHKITDAHGYNYAVEVVATANGGDFEKLSPGAKQFYATLRNVSTNSTWDVNETVVKDKKTTTRKCRNGGL